MAEMDFGGLSVPASTDTSEIGFALEALHQVLDVGFLEELP